MMKGTKRKATQKDEAKPSSSQLNHMETKMPATSRAKRVKAAPKPENEVEVYASSSQDNHKETWKKFSKPESQDEAKASITSQEEEGVAPPAGEVATKPESEDEAKASNSSQEDQQEDLAPPAKRAKVAKSKPEPEYFEEKRNLEDLWKTAFPVGTEWDQLDTLYQFKWDFSNLEEEFEEGGKLHGNKVYIFVTTEPQLVPYKEENRLILVPAVVAVVSPIPPSDMIGINSVQREAEEIVPMRQMKMGWVPYLPLENRDSQVERLNAQIFVLSCTQRRTALRHLKIDRLKKYEYCLPYFYNPWKEDELEESTEVQIFFPIEPPVVTEFDWEFDEIDEFTDKLVEDEALPKEEKDVFKEFVNDKVRDAQRANREAREARLRSREEMSEETKTAFNNMRFYKFYPVKTPDTPDVSKVKCSFINRYYGKAHEVF